ncbi:MAG: glycoside hydrolase family 97 C-terminal domain-containing protein, partial [Bacteroidales bacterium]|nr:glycoside hydrolase family 97 C-terminal domain-containing protein [Bacteroidales bacterium]
TVARRSEDNWYIGAITNNDARSIDIPLSFLEKEAKYEATIYYDDDTMDSRTNVNSKIQKVKAKQILHFDLKASGGVAIQIVEQ